MIILNTLIAVLSVLLKFFATPTFFSELSAVAENCKSIRHPSFYPPLDIRRQISGGNAGLIRFSFPRIWISAGSTSADGFTNFGPCYSFQFEFIKKGAEPDETFILQVRLSYDLVCLSSVGSLVGRHNFLNAAANGPSATVRQA